MVEVSHRGTVISTTLECQMKRVRLGSTPWQYAADPDHPPETDSARLPRAAEFSEITNSESCVVIQRSGGRGETAILAVFLMLFGLVALWFWVQGTAFRGLLMTGPLLFAGFMVGWAFETTESVAPIYFPPVWIGIGVALLVAWAPYLLMGRARYSSPSKAPGQPPRPR